MTLAKSNRHYISIKCGGCFTYAIMDEFYLSLLSDSSMDIFLQINSSHLPQS